MLLDDIYGSYLIDVYKDNPRDLIMIIKSIIDGDKCISDLLNHFGLSLRNMDLVKGYYDKIDGIALTKHY